MNKTLLAVAALSLAACTEPEHATEILEANGYRDVRITGYSIFGCGEKDFFHTGFTATALNGKAIDGVVCSGLLFKNSTIRF